MKKTDRLQDVNQYVNNRTSIWTSLTIFIQYVKVLANADNC